MVAVSPPSPSSGCSPRSVPLALMTVVLTDPIVRQGEGGSDVFTLLALPILSVDAVVVHGDRRPLIGLALDIVDASPRSTDDHLRGLACASDGFVNIVLHVRDGWAGLQQP